MRAQQPGNEIAAAIVAIPRRQHAADGAVLSAFLLQCAVDAGLYEPAAANLLHLAAYIVGTGEAVTSGQVAHAYKTLGSLVLCLRFLLPELDATSGEAAGLVRTALELLAYPDAGSRGTPFGYWQ